MKRSSKAPRPTRQRYGPSPRIQGVALVKLKRHLDDGGSLSELLRVGQANGDIPAGFDLSQVNASELEPGAVKAWHLHERQDDVWFVFPGARVLLGMWDVRPGSKTRDVQQRVVLGPEPMLAYIPRGVAHGAANLGRTTAHVVYLLNQRFDMEKPDELRLPWDAAGPQFWSMRRE